MVGEGEMCKVTDFGMARDVQQDNFYERRTKVCDGFLHMIVHDLLYNVRLSFEATSSVKWKYQPIMKELTRRKKGCTRNEKKDNNSISNCNVVERGSK